MAGTIVGLDIGSTLRAVEVSGGAKPAIVRAAEVALPEGATRRGDVQEVATVASAIRQLWSRARFRSRRAVIGVGGPNVFAREFSVPAAPLAQIRESLPFQAQELLPVAVSDAVLDFYPIGEERGENGPMVAGLLVAAVKAAVSANVAALTSAGLRPARVDLVPFALARAITPLRRSAGRIAIVDIGAETTNIVMVADGVPHFVRIIPAGGADITKAIAERMEWPPDQAETVKRTVGMGGQLLRVEDRPVIETVYRAVGDLASSIRNTLTYVATAQPGLPIDQVVLTGGGGRLAGFAAALGELLGLPVTHAAPPPLPRGRSGELHSDFGVAYGLAIGGRE